MKDKVFVHKCEITCFVPLCKFNTSYRTEYKRGFCRAGKVAMGAKGCLEKHTDDLGED